LKNQTPSTPAIPHMYALNAQLDDMMAEGVEGRFARHDKMAGIVQTWSKKHFDIFPEEGYWSPTLTCVKNTREIDVAELIKTLASDFNVRIANGYGDIKGKTFRIAHMGDTQVDEVEGVLKVIETVLGL
jgi:aspartate aminotransferase-like enzyme